MTVTVTQTNAVDRNKTAFVKFVDDAASPAAYTATVGFTPSYVRYVNLTTRVEFEWYSGMAATYTLKTVAAGTRTADTGSGIVVSGRTITVAAPAQNDVCFIEAVE